MTDTATENTEQAPAAVPAEPTATGAAPEGNNSPVETNNFQQRINTVVGQRNAEKTRADLLQQQIDSAQKVATPGPDQEPSLESCDYDQDKHTKALIDYRINAGIKKATAELTQNQQKVVNEQRNAQTLANFEKKRIEFAGKTADYPTVIDNLVNIAFPQDTLNLIMGADNGPALAYHLGKNLDIALSISQMPLGEAAMKLGMLTSTLSPATLQKIPSKAPVPIEAITSGGALSPTADYENMTMEQIAAS